MKALRILQTIMAIVWLAGCGGGGGSSSGGGSGPAPQAQDLRVISATVAEGGVAFDPRDTLTVFCNIDLADSASIAPYVELSDRAGPVPVALRIQAGSVVVAPAAPLKVRTAYRLTVKAGLKAANGAVLAADYTLNFKTSVAAFERRMLMPPVPGFWGSFDPLVATADFDGDGRMDIAQMGRPLNPTPGTIAEQGYSLLLYRQDAQGTLSPVQQIDVVAPSQTVLVTYAHLLALDIDGDEGPEILVSQRVPGMPSHTGVQVYKRDHTGAFVAHAFHVGPWWAWQLAVIDLDGDGRQDLVGNYAVGDSSVLEPRFRAILNRAAGLLPMDEIAPVSGGSSLVFGDIDRDGRLEAVVDSEYQRTVYSQEAPGKFLPRPDLSQLLVAACPTTFESRCIDLSLIDLDGDGWLDLLFGSVGARKSRAYLRQPGAGFVAGFEVSYGDGRNFFEVADLDGDGLHDLTIINNELLAVGMGQGQPALEYSPAYFNGVFDTLQRPSMAFVDFDGDGRMDVILNAINSGITVNLQTGQPRN